MIHIATIGKTVGLDGDLKLHLFTDFPNQFKAKSIFKSDNNLDLEIQRYNKKKSTVKFVGFDNKEDSTKLINKKLYSTEEDTRKNCHLNKDEYYWFDIINCDIVENNRVLGTISNIEQIATTHYFEVQTSSQLLEENSKLPKSFLIPYLDNYILSIDIENKVINSKDAILILENS
jgi:16S rRNA processing protein RimM